MYYLDFHQLYKATNKDARIEVRKMLNRDDMMAKRLKLQRDQCFWCGTVIDMTGHLDHIIPVYYGGDNKPRNLVAACRSCNLTKNTDQIEITNTYVIADYLKLIDAKKKFDAQYKVANDKQKYLMKKYLPKRLRLYKVYRADLFKEA